VPGQPEHADITLARLAQTADSLAAAMRAFSGDLATALWLFEHAGGEAAVQAFIDQVQRVHTYPHDSAEQRKLLDMAPNAARLLQATSMLVSSLSPAEVIVSDVAGVDEAELDTAEHDPVTWP
jgi:hypothetical protein